MGLLRARSRGGMLWRVFFAALLIVGSCAGAVAAAGLLQVGTLVADISVNQGIDSKQIVLPKPGKPQTLLLIGSDHRSGESFSGSRTDTMLLVRLNSASSTINVISIPRDLEVDIPGFGGPTRLNSAYEDGGYGLLIKTIRQEVFPGFHPNHVIDTNFTGFSDLVDAIGCVYSDVDHRYYNLSSLTGYSSIDIQPGYQRLCGHGQSVHGALPFVRFRHTDSDLVRAARQQDFLRWAKQGFPITKLLAERDKLLRIFGTNSTLDNGLKHTDQLIDLFNLIAFAHGDTIKQIKFPVTGEPIIDGADYVSSDATSEKAAYRKFLAPTRRTSKPASKPTPTIQPGRIRHPTHGSQIDTHGLSADPLDGLAQAKALTHPGMPVYYPRLIASGAVYCMSVTGNCDDPTEPATEYAHSYPRQYLIPTQSGTKVHAYRMTVDVNSTLGRYIGIQGMHWRDPPLLGNPNATKVVKGRTLLLYTDDGGHLTTVAWRQGENSYWISNDLTSDIPNNVLVGMAASMVRYHGG